MGTEYILDVTDLRFNLCNPANGYDVYYDTEEELISALKYHGLPAELADFNKGFHMKGNSKYLYGECRNEYKNWVAIATAPITKRTVTENEM